MATLLQQPARVFSRLMIPLLLCLTFSSNALATSVQKGGTVTFSAKDVKLREVFREIKKQTGYSLMYSNKKVPLNLDQRVTVDFNKSIISDVMENLLKGKNLQWQIDDESILIFLKQIEPQQTNVERDTVDVIPNLAGRVVDGEGKPIPGASISISKTNSGTTTDGNGNFIISNVRKNSTLLVSSIGFETREVIVQGGTILIKLNIVVSDLDETVVIAYGTTTKRYSTGNISSVKAKDIEKQPVTNPLLALQGRVPGLLVNQASGISGSGLLVRIQGQNSIGNGNDPLYVVDGVPISSNLLTTGVDGVLGDTYGSIPGATASSGNPLNFLNPLDIESIDILKDADATAIYGSRAANGAILITTKKGIPGKAKVDINLQTGWGEVARKIKMLSAREYLDMRYEAYSNDGIDWTDPSVSANDLKIWDTTANNDWQKLLIGETARYTNINASLSGGTSTVQYRIAGTYNNQTTVFPVPDDFSNKKASLNFNLTTSSANKKFYMRFVNNFMVDRNQLPATDLTSTSIITAPIAPNLFNDDGTLNWEPDQNGNSTFLNPLSVLYRRYKSSTKNIISNLSLDYHPFGGLEIGSSFGYTLTETNDFVPTPITAIRPEWRDIVEQRSASFANRSLRSWIIEPQIRYKKEFGNIKLDALVGSTIMERHDKTGRIIATGFTSDEVLEDPASATFWNYDNSTILKYKYSAAFGRLNLILSDKYILNISGRRDGSSRFGAKNRFHNFGAAGFAWILSNELFLHDHFTWISYAKIRGSYGNTGNDQIGDYNFLSTYQPVTLDVPYQGVGGIALQKLPNPQLQWEETRKFQVGLDLGLFKDRMMLNLTYINNRSSNQLVVSRLPSFIGVSDFLQNFPATVSNKSFEISLNIEPVKGSAFTWVSNFNVTIPNNKLVAFPNLEESVYANTLIVGKPLYIEKTYHLLGVNTANGEYEFATKNGDATTAPSFPDDYNVIIDMTPQLYGGFQNSFTYKGFTLDFLFQFTKQKGSSFLYGNNSRATPGSFFRTGSNQPATVLDRWQKPGDITPIQKFTSQVNDPLVLAVRGSDAQFTDASYIRLKNISIAWQFPAKMIGKYSLNSCQLYLQSQNLLTITNYKGLDPETRSTNILPPLKMVTIGIRGSF